MIHSKKIEESVSLVKGLLINLRARKAIDLTSIENRVSTEYHLNNILYSIEKLISSSKMTIKTLESFPSEKEMHGAVSGLFLLHQTYHFNWTDLISNGLKVPRYSPIKRIKTDFNIYAKDFEVLGKIAFKRKLYDQAYELFNVALHLAEQNNETDSIRNTKNLINVVIQSHDRTLNEYSSHYTQGVYSHYICTTKFNDTKHQALRENRKPTKRKIDLFNPFVTEKQKTYQFQKLCRGERIRSYKEDIDLKSFYLQHDDSFLRLGPFKVEPKNNSPYVAVFHNFFHPKETEAFVEYASPNLERSETFIKEGELGSSLSRTTKQVYVPENDTRLPIAGVISDRICFVILFGQM